MHSHSMLSRLVGSTASERLPRLQPHHKRKRPAPSCAHSTPAKRGQHHPHSHVAFHRLAKRLKVSVPSSSSRGRARSWAVRLLHGLLHHQHAAVQHPKRALPSVRSGPGKVGFGSTHAITRQKPNPTPSESNLPSTIPPRLVSLLHHARPHHQNLASPGSESDFWCKGKQRKEFAPSLPPHGHRVAVLHGFGCGVLLQQLHHGELPR